MNKALINPYNHHATRQKCTLNFSIPKITYQKYHHSKRDDLSLTLIPIKKKGFFFPGRFLRLEPTATKPMKRKEHDDKNQTSKGIMFQPLIFQGGGVNMFIHPSPFWVHRKTLSQTEALDAWSGQKTTHIKPCGISTRSVHLNVCQQLKKKGPPPYRWWQPEIWRFQNKISWGTR